MILLPAGIFFFAPGRLGISKPCEAKYSDGRSAECRRSIYDRCNILNRGELQSDHSESVVPLCRSCNWRRAARIERRREHLRLLGRRSRVQVAARRGKRAVAHRVLDGHDIDAVGRQQRPERVA